MDKTELLIFMTPHVITTQEEAEKLTSNFKNKVDSLREMLKEKEEKEREGEDSKFIMQITE